MSHETAAVARAETMLAIADATGIDVEALAFLAVRFERHLGMIDAAEPGRSGELERLIAVDIAELVDAYRKMAAAVERGGRA